jgi:hypothetical protein
MSVWFRCQLLKIFLPEEIIRMIYIYLKQSFTRDVIKAKPINLVNNLKIICIRSTLGIRFSHSIAERMYAGELGRLVSIQDWVEIQGMRKQIWREKVEMVYVMYSVTTDRKWKKHF